MCNDYIFLLCAYWLMTTKNIYSHNVCMMVFMRIVSMHIVNMWWFFMHIVSMWWFLWELLFLIQKGTMCMFGCV